MHSLVEALVHLTYSLITFPQWLLFLFFSIFIYNSILYNFSPLFVFLTQIIIYIQTEGINLFSFCLYVFFYSMKRKIMDNFNIFNLNLAIFITFFGTIRDFLKFIFFQLFFFFEFFLILSLSTSSSGYFLVSVFFVFFRLVLITLSRLFVSSFISIYKI